MTRKSNMKKIQLKETDLPLHWQEKLVAEQKVGGVVLVFLEGRNKAKLKKKTRDINKLVREYRKTYLSQNKGGK